MGRAAGEAKGTGPVLARRLGPRRPLSPTERHFLFLEFGPGAGAFDAAVYMRKTDGSAAVRLGEGRPLAISPDGTTVLAPRRTPGSLPHLVLLPTGPGRRSPLPTTASPDSTGRSGCPTARESCSPPRRKTARPALCPRSAGRQRAADYPRGRRAPGRCHETVSPDGQSVLAFSGTARPLSFRSREEIRRPVAGLNPGDRAVQWTGGRTFPLRGSPEEIAGQGLAARSGDRKPAALQGDLCRPSRRTVSGTS